ncbi:hypothetical protein [Glutamicibacter sp. M10]|uniref:hypothetical protein n=1 Tax=Glutamicibacter sp. M10 TaxID=3023076 RepID=UPI00290570D6|nr:hypothetical protein [Glutamicibacter sp. M10]
MPTLTLDSRTVLRLLEVSDAAQLAEAYVRNREHLRPWDPEREDAFSRRPGMQKIFLKLSRPMNTVWRIHTGCFATSN